MKHSIALLAAATTASILMAGTALADSYAQQNNIKNDWYLGLSGDLTWLRHSDTGGGGNVALGYRFVPSSFGDWRLEAEAGYHGAPGRGGFSNTHYITYMGNLYYDFNNMFPSSSSGWHVAPYIGGGLGDAALHSGHSTLSNTFHHHENTFAYEGMAGLTMVADSMPNTDWSLGYRYVGTDKNNIASNNLELGVRFHF